jgi:AbrB family looped-hinge helix DNA binding protein
MSWPRGRVKVSSKNQIAVPAEVRRELGIERGDHLIVEDRDGFVVLKPEPVDAVEQLRGLHREIWEGIDPQQYIDELREEW